MNEAESILAALEPMAEEFGFQTYSGPCDAWSEIRDEAEAFYQEIIACYCAEPGPQVQSFADVFGPALAMCPAIDHDAMANLDDLPL